MDNELHETEEKKEQRTVLEGLPRRAVLKAAGASAALSFGSGATAAHTADARGRNADDEIDPVFGLASAGPNPCDGDASADCFEEFPEDVRPSHEVEVHIDIPGPLFALAAQGGLSELTTGTINEEVADGEVRARNLHRPDASVTIETPGGSESLTVAEIANLVAETKGFHYSPPGLHVQSGDVVVFSAETPDHGVAAYHERHGRQRRVPKGVGPIAAPLIPAGGYWLYRFDEPGVYDLYCPPHQVFGMVLRVVVHDGGDAPQLSVGEKGRPPEHHNFLPTVLEGIDPNVPSSHDALMTDALTPERIVNEGSVPWSAVVAEHRES